MDKEKRTAFYQSKYEYYKGFNRGILIISCITYLIFFLTDCGIYNRFSYETIHSRAIILLPLSIFLYMYKKVDNYKIMVPFSYLIVHMIIWCSAWSTYILPDREFASEGLIVMNMIFVCAGFCAPYMWAGIAHCVLIADILVANCFIHYDNLVMILLFNAPCVFAVWAMHRIMEKVYLEHYLVTEKLEELVVHDQLTGVYNRNKFKEITDPFTEAFNIPKDIPLTLMLIDSDYFKNVNDTYGHEAGDVVLKHIANILKDSVRASDYVIRWGGEEFIVILTGCKLDKGAIIAEKIREDVEKSNNPICSITVSIGVAGYESGSYHTVIEAADKALYRAKKEGRNRVIIYENSERKE